MDSRKDYYNNSIKYLNEIKSISNNFQFVKKDPFNWQSYLDITDVDKIFVPRFEERDHIHKHFLYSSNVGDEGLFMQWLGCLGHQNWLFRFGNVKMLLWIPESTAIKVIAPVGSNSRARCSVIAQTFSDCKLIAVQKQGNLKKFNQTVLENDDPLLVDANAFTGSVPMTLIELNPKDTAVYDIYSWDFVVRNLMILKRLTVAEAVKNLGPGAEDYFQLLPKELLKTTIKELDSEDFMTITKLFDAWAFKPPSLFDYFVHERGN